MATINGTVSDDVLIGTSADDVILGGDGYDLLAGGAGNDVLDGGAGNDTLDGGAGNDSLISSGGSDTYIFGVGSGQDTLELTASTTYNETSTIQMAGLALADVTFSRGVNNPYDLVITINGTNETFTVKNFAWHTTDVYFQFSDVVLDWHSDVTRSLPEVWAGTDGNDRLYAWGYSQAVMNGNAGDDDLNGTQYDDIVNGGDGNDQLSGGMVNTSSGWVSGNDTLDGGAGDDLLNGMQGNDMLIGGTGNDTYWFNLGDGQDTIQEYDYTPGNVDTIRFGPGIAASDLSFTRNGMDLVLGIAGTTDQLTIQKWGWNEAGRIERIVLADGTMLKCM